MEKDIYGFRVDFELDSGKSFLVLSENGPEKHEVIGFQVEMIAKNKIPGVAVLNIREKDLERRFYYDISGLVSLSNFFKRQKISKADFNKILQNITGALTGCKNYLLNDKCFVIREDLIFVNPASLEVFLIYIPCTTNIDIVALFKSFVVNLIVKTANIETDDNFVQKILELIKEEHLCISEFNSALRRGEGTAHNNEASSGKQYSYKPGINSVESGNIPCEQEVPQSVNRKQAGNFAPAILILLIIAAAVAVNINKTLGGTGIELFLSDNFRSVGAVAAIILSAGIIIYVRLRKKSSYLKERKPILKEEYVKKQEIVTSTEIVKNEDNHVNVEETIVLSSQLQPILVGIGAEENIVISNNDFVIGRNVDTCDYVISNKSIGRAHARIQNNDGKFFIFDLDSKNGTFLNGDRLISNKQYELKPADRVTFANLQFCFKIE